MSVSPPSVLDLLRGAAERAPASPALLAPGRAPQAYSGLLDQVQRTVESLKQNGIRPSDRVALMLPDGPEMAAALLGTVAVAACVPPKTDSGPLLATAPGSRSPESAAKPNGAALGMEELCCCAPAYGVVSVSRTAIIAAASGPVI